MCCSTEEVNCQRVWCHCRDFVTLRHWKVSEEHVILSSGIAVTHPVMPPCSQHVRSRCLFLSVSKCFCRLVSAFLHHVLRSIDCCLECYVYDIFYVILRQLTKILRVPYWRSVFLKTLILMKIMKIPMTAGSCLNWLNVS